MVKLEVDGRMLKLTLGEGQKDDFDYIDQALIQTNGERLSTPEWILGFQQRRGFPWPDEGIFLKDCVSQSYVSVALWTLQEDPLGYSFIFSFLSVAGLIQSAHFIAHNVN